MSRISHIVRSKSLRLSNYHKVIALTFCNKNYVEECFPQTHHEEKSQQKTQIGFGNIYLPRNDPMRGRFTKVTCGLPSRPIFANPSDSGLLPSNPAVFLIPKRWKQCPAAADRAAPPPATCTKTPTNLLPSEFDVIDPSIPQPRVVIVGAGLAGISAAYRLSNRGFKNYQIIEATDRPGGRIHSCWLGDVVGELGSLWISQASVANPLFALAVQENLLKDPLPWRRVPPASKTPFLSSDGRAIEPCIAGPAASLFGKIRDQAASLFSMDVGKSHGSLSDFFKKRLSEEMKSIPDTWQPDVTKVIYGLLNEFKTRFGSKACSVSSDMFGSTVSLPGGAVRVPIGLVGILGPLLKGIDSKCIGYCRPVQGITWHGGNPRATVRLSGGDVLTADYVIVTLPLGVLKCSLDSLFSPGVPEAKVNAINKVGFGTVNRILLKYAKPFWLPGEGFYRLSWSERELKDKESWTKGISLIENVPGTSNMLMISLGDDEAVMTESCSDVSLAEEITKTLRQFSGDPSLPYPIGITRSKWASEPFFRGSTSYASVGCTVQDLCELSSPLPGLDCPGAPIVLFAGEAACPGYSGMLAAHISGVREADRVIALTKKYSGLPPTGPTH